MVHDESAAMAGGWFDQVLTIATTVGKIAGALSGAGLDAMVDIGPVGGAAHPELGQVKFLNNADCSVEAWNDDGDSDVGISFEGDRDVAALAPETVIVPLTQSLNVSPAFRRCVAGNFDGMTVTPMPSTPDLAPGDVPAGVGDINIQTGTSQPIPANGTEIRIGSFITARLSPASERTLTIGVVGALTLTAIVLVSATAGKNVVRIINAVRKPNPGTTDDNQHITVAIPAGPDLTEGLAGLDVSVAVGNMSAFKEQWVREHAHLLRPLTDEDYARLDRIAKARRG